MNEKVMNGSTVGTTVGAMYGFEYLENRHEYVRHLCTKSKKKIIIRIEVDEWCVFIAIGNRVSKVSNGFENYKQALTWQTFLDLSCLLAPMKKMK